ncbi:hypothetical protein BU26DRAFT_558892 [Trematosphaeria pertusa]|uniref:Uncharacterized protein n=1 Tax=Trematosphaeria pertusa TaxID=390896 RepID=A0A6A6IYB8_9PLEO|nr:uncharacterized protein BU26DRAFT_558892 [Trematosphaeria pertusa]KAF2254173.1 hypothetical protein BU26DRAFT_558892 [Trematosphaeria pertusa]
MVIHQRPATPMDGFAAAMPLYNMITAETDARLREGLAAAVGHTVAAVSRRTTAAMEESEARIVANVLAALEHRGLQREDPTAHVVQTLGNTLADRLDELHRTFTDSVQRSQQELAVQQAHHRRLLAHTQQVLRAEDHHDGQLHNERIAELQAEIDRLTREVVAHEMAPPGGIQGRPARQVDTPRAEEHRRREDERIWEEHHGQGEERHREERRRQEGLRRKGKQRQEEDEHLQEEHRQQEELLQEQRRREEEHVQEGYHQREEVRPQEEQEIQSERSGQDNALAEVVADLQSEVTTANNQVRALQPRLDDESSSDSQLERALEDAKRDRDEALSRLQQAQTLVAHVRTSSATGEAQQQRMFDDCVVDLQAQPDSSQEVIEDLRREKDNTSSAADMADLWRRLRKAEQDKMQKEKELRQMKALVAQLQGHLARQHAQEAQLLQHRRAQPREPSPAPSDSSSSSRESVAARYRVVTGLVTAGASAAAH